MPNGNNPQYFIDTHCHLFNVEHVPLRLTIRRITENFNKGLIKRGLLAAGAAALGGLAAPLLAAGSNALAKKFYRAFEAFIRFFDQPAGHNIADIADSLKALGATAEMDRRLRILTPLTMDFERCEPYKSLAGQVGDLQAAIADSAALLKRQRMLILPFLGMDLRRFHDQPAAPAAALQAFFSDCKTTFKSAAARRNPGQLASGDMIGIKLYPSLGFDIFPNDAAQRERNAQILAQLKQLDIPVTTHCQIASYACDPGDVADRTLINFANPEKWWQLLEAYPALGQLRINFAHFGGEQGIAKVLMWNDEVPDPEASYRTPGDLFSSSWTYWIIKLVKTYPHAYADISAFDFADKKAVASLAWLLARDNQGQYDGLGSHRLIDKLMWGSDVPMILSDHGTYRQLFDAFYGVLDFPQADTGNYGLPPAADLPDRDTLFHRLVDANPRKFLFAD